MKRILIFIFVFVYTITIKSQVKFDNRIWEKCKVPIVTLHTVAGDKQFIIDTGSSYSFIDCYFAERYGTYYKSIVVNYTSIDGDTNKDDIIFKININNIQYQMFGMNMKYINNTVVPYNVIGILGIDFIIANKLTLDFNNRELIFNKQ